MRCAVSAVTRAGIPALRPSRSRAFPIRPATPGVPGFFRAFAAAFPDVRAPRPRNGSVYVARSPAPERRILAPTSARSKRRLRVNRPRAVGDYLPSVIESLRKYLRRRHVTSRH